MNLNEVRKELERLCCQILSGSWMVTTRTWPELSGTWTCQIGHPMIEPYTLDGRRVDLPVLLWVQEDNAADAVDDVYAAVSYDEGSFIAQLEATKPFVIEVRVVSIGPREEQPANFIAAELLVSCRAAAV